MNIRRVKLFEGYFLTLTTLVCFNGILSDFLPTIGGLGFGTVVLDSFLLIGVFVFLAKIFNDHALWKREVVIISIFFVFAGLVFLKSALDGNGFLERILGWRNYFLYSFPLILPLVIRLDYRRLLHFIISLMTLICLFAITQYIFRSFYPDALLKLKVEENNFNFYGYNIVRVNGLIGNTIIFTGFSIMAALLNFNTYIKTKRTAFLIGTIVSYIAMVLTFSRAAWVFGTAILFFDYLIISRLEIKRMIASTIMILLSSSVLYSWIINNQESFLYQRIFSQEASTRGSNLVHAQQSAAALQAIASAPMLGTGLGSQGGSADINKVIITDGWLLQTALEFGVPLTIVLLIFIITINFYGFLLMMIRDPVVDIFVATAVSSTAYFLLTSFLNSALTGKTVYILYFVILGLVLGVSRRRA